MDNRIEKIRDDIRRTEDKKRELDEYLKTLKMRERQLCDEEILKSIRTMAGKGDVLEVLKKLKEDPDKKYDYLKQKAEDSSKKESAAFSVSESEDEDEEHETI